MTRGEQRGSATTAPDRRRCGLGRLIPLTLGTWFVLSVGLRFLPGEWLPINPMQMAVRHTGRHAPFTPNLRLFNAHPKGGTAVEGNLPQTEFRSPIQFTSDRLGFRRNPEVAEKSEWDALVFGGDSFIYGAALSDEESFPAQLTRISGINVYNAGRFHLDVKGAHELDWLLARLPGSRSTAIFVYLEHQQLRGVGESAGTLGRLLDAYPQLESELRYARRLYRIWMSISPLDIAAIRIYKSLSDDRFLPNHYKRAIRQVPLPDGTHMLFTGYEQGPANSLRDATSIRRNAERIELYRRQLASRGIRMLVLLLPTKYTVYAPFIENGPKRQGAENAVRYLNELERELLGRKIHTVNALTIFRESVPEELRNGGLSYFREDNHWTPLGVRRVASVVAEVMATAGFLPAEISQSLPGEADF